MNLVADESVDAGITEVLRKKGINVFSIAEEAGGIKDTEVLELAVKNNALLITEDKDFGELAFRLKFQHKGILIRLSEVPRNERLSLAVETVFSNLNKLTGNFSVLTKNGLLIKILNKKTS